MRVIGGSIDVHEKRSSGIIQPPQNYPNTLELNCQRNWRYIRKMAYKYVHIISVSRAHKCLERRGVIQDWIFSGVLAQQLLKT